MAKHVDGLTCPSCDAKLQSAHPELRRWFSEFVKPMFPSAHVSCAFRDKNEQNRAYTERKSRARWPKSMHNNIGPDGTPCALAIDLFEIASNGVACWSWKYFRRIADAAKEAGHQIEWGGDFTSIKDGPHFQLASRIRNQLG